MLSVVCSCNSIRRLLTRLVCLARWFSQKVPRFKRGAPQVTPRVLEGISGLPRCFYAAVQRLMESVFVPPRTVDPSLPVSSFDVEGPVVDLADTRLWDRGAASLAAVLRNNRSVTSLCLARTNLSPTGCVLLTEALVTCHSLTHLDVSGNRVGNKGAAALAELLTGVCSDQVNWTLTHTVSLFSTHVHRHPPQCGA
jgi:hypothetical protein